MRFSTSSRKAFSIRAKKEEST